MNYKLPKGYKLSGVKAEIKPHKKDIGIIISNTPAVVAGVTTKSTTAAACVAYDKKIFDHGQAQAIIVNSGNANAFTGAQGEADVVAIADKVAKEFSLQSDKVIVASTGIIGKKLPMDKISSGIEILAQDIKAEKSGKESIRAFSEAIKTTDLTDKIISKEIEIDGKKTVITGVAKGSGMIHPNMATMLAYIITDLDIDHGDLKRLVQDCSNNSFNMISVDGDTSTNDMVVVMANGQSGINYKDLKSCEDGIDLFAQELQDIFIYLAKEIARDGEGASKLIEAQVTGAANKTEARRAAKSIIISPLVKTAVYGESDNIGRVIMAVGSAEVVVDMDKIKVSWQGLKTKNVLITVDLGLASDFTATAWGCDLTEKYISINTDYN